MIRRPAIDITFLARVARGFNTAEGSRLLAARLAGRAGGVPVASPAKSVERKAA